MRALVWSVLIVVSGCAGTTFQAAPAGRTLAGDVPVRMVVRGSTYAGTAKLTTDRAGVVTGTLAVAGPAHVNATVTGKITGQAVELTLKYLVEENRCTGTMTLAGTYASPAAASVDGNVSAVDSCVGNMSGTFRLGAQ